MAVTMDTIQMWRWCKERKEYVKYRSPFQSGWVISLRNLEKLWISLRNEQFKHLNLRQLNQDPLETLFGRMGSCRNQPRRKGRSLHSQTGVTRSSSRR